MFHRRNLRYGQGCRRDERSPNYYLDWAFDEMRKLVETLPKSVHERVFVVRLALDVDLQKSTDKAVESSLRQYGREYKVKQGAADGHRRRRARDGRRARL